MSLQYEKSCGAVVFTHSNGGIKYVIIQSLEGYYGFPKGHMETGETEVETALREIYEETGLKVHILDGFRCEDEHPIPSKPGVMKRIVYFAAEYEDQQLRHQPEELMSVKLMTFEEAMDAFQWESSRRILREVADFLTVRIKMSEMNSR